MFCGMVATVVPLWHERQCNEALLKKQRSWQSQPHALTGDKPQSKRLTVLGIENRLFFILILHKNCLCWQGPFLGRFCE